MIEETFIEFCKEVNEGFDALATLIEFHKIDNEDINEILKEGENVG